MSTNGIIKPNKQKWKGAYTHPHPSQDSSLSWPIRHVTTPHEVVFSSNRTYLLSTELLLRKHYLIPFKDG